MVKPEHDEKPLLVSSDEATPCSSTTLEPEHQRPNRTVNDYERPQELLRALQFSTEVGTYHTPVESGCAWINSSLHSDSDDGGMARIEEHLRTMFENTEKLEMQNLDQALDWVLENYDAETTHQQTMEEELRRLLVLKSFLALDIERHEAFDRITALAQEYFRCPINIIGLMDLGRQWLVSSIGFGDAKEVPRKATVCIHTLQSNLDCFVVPDTTKDARFSNSSFVTGPPEIRFYAGVPLISKEGYKLGTLCIVDYVARPEGLSDDDRETLKALAAEAMTALELHRKSKVAWFKNLKQTCFPSLNEVESLLETETKGVDDKIRQHEMDEVHGDAKINVPKLIEEMGKLAWKDLLMILHNQTKDATLPGMDVFLRKCASLAGAPTKRARTTPSSLCRRKKIVRFLPKPTNFLIDSCKDMKGLWWTAMDLFSFRGRATLEVNDYKENESHFTLCVEAMASEEDVSEVVDCLLHITQLPYSRVRGLESHIADMLSLQRKAVVRAVLDEQGKLTKSDIDSKAMQLRLASEAKSETSTRFSERIAKCDEYVAMNLYKAIFHDDDASSSRELVETSSSSCEDQP